MKNLQGLIIALGLGVAAALVNWAYLHSASSRLATIDYIGVRPGQTVLRGERLAEEKLVRVPIPAGNAGSLDTFAVKWSDIQTVLGKAVARTLVGGSLLLEDDLRTPPTELELKKPQPGGNEEEVAIFVPVDMRAFVPSLVQPGDRVSFLLGSGGGPTPAGAPAPAAGRDETIGPFVVLALGNRLSSDDVAKAATAPTAQQNVLTIRVRLVGGRFEEKAQRLLKAIDRTNRGLGVMLHPRE
ncbi:MAG: hypothetical protein JW809_18690 [Pirellulales bacterium]|nr:hypothetical protein [Pirellulales bacterium]